MLCVRRIFLKALQVPKWIQLDPWLLHENFSQKNPQITQDTSNWITLWDAVKHLNAAETAEALSSLPLLILTPIATTQQCWIRILIHGQLLKDLGLFHDCLFNKLSSTSCSQLYFTLIWSSPFYSLKSSFNIILLYLTSFSNPSTMLIYYIMLQENTIIMGGHGQRDESNFPSNHPARLKISGENPETEFLEEPMCKAEQ